MTATFERLSKADRAIALLMDGGLTRQEATIEYVNSLPGPEITEEQVEELHPHAGNGAQPPPGIEPDREPGTDDDVPARFLSADHLDARFPPEWLTEQPPPVDWLVDTWIPAGKVGLIVGEGGLGKSTLLVAVLMSIATGLDLIGMKPKAPSSVLYLSLEDDEDTVRRRLYWMTQRLTGSLMTLGELGYTPARFCECLNDNLRIRFASGYSCHLIRSVYQDIQQTEKVLELAEYAKSLGSTSLIALDTVSRVHALNENDNAVGVAGIAALETLARLTGAAVIAPHHTGKQSARDRTEDQYAGRGASSWADNARYIWRLMPATSDECVGLEGIDQGTVKRAEVLKLAMTKLNCAVKPEPIYLLRQNSEIQALKSTVSHDRDRDIPLRDELIEYCRANSVTAFSLRELQDLAGRIWPERHISQLHVREFVAVAKQRGWLIETKVEGARGGARLTFPGG